MKVHKHVKVTKSNAEFIRLEFSKPIELSTGHNIYLTSTQWSSFDFPGKEEDYTEEELDFKAYVLSHPFRLESVCLDFSCLDSVNEIVLFESLDREELFYEKDISIFELIKALQSNIEHRDCTCVNCSEVNSRTQDLIIMLEKHAEEHKTKL